jgi:prepilin-type N-terminal cleavage/methylation domain-containing protein
MSQRMTNRSGESGFTILETLLVVALIGVISAIAVPQVANSIAYFRVSGDARTVSNAVAVTKMRAAANFSRTRLFVNLADRTHHIEKGDTSSPTHWTVEGGSNYLSTGVSFGYGVVAAPPLNTQSVIGQSTNCLNDSGIAIANTACVIFNSRGVPITSSGTSISDNAVYLTDGSAVYAVTISATGMIRMWHTRPAATPEWTLQ